MLRTNKVGALSVTVDASSTGYTSSFQLNYCAGFISLLITSTAGTVTITQQCSVDGITFYDPVDASNAALGAVAAGMTVGSRYVQPNPVLAAYARYKIVETGGAAGSTVTVLPVIHGE